MMFGVSPRDTFDAVLVPVADRLKQEPESLKCTREAIPILDERYRVKGPVVCTELTQEQHGGPCYPGLEQSAVEDSIRAEVDRQILPVTQIVDLNHRLIEHDALSASLSRCRFASRTRSWIAVRLRSNPISRDTDWYSNAKAG